MTKTKAGLAITSLLITYYFQTFVLAVHAQTTRADGRTAAITTAVPFLQITPDSRGGALGDAGVANTDGPNALFWNPAALPFGAKKVGFGLNYTPWLRGLGIPDINHAFLPAYYNIGENGGIIGAALTVFDLGDINFTDAQGSNLGVASSNEFAIATSYARKISSGISAGVSLRYIYSNLANTAYIGTMSTNPAQSVAGDLHFYTQKKYEIKSGKNTKIPMTAKFGINLSNIGAKMRYSSNAQGDFLPTNLKIGYALKFELDESNSITLVNDFNKLMVPSEGGQADVPLMSGMFGSFTDRKLSEEISEINPSVGLEYWYENLFAGRIGYFYEDPNKGNRQYLTFGLGIRFKTFTLDGSFLLPTANNHPLANTFRFSLTFDFE